MNESEETEEIKTFSLYLYLLQGWQTLSSCKQISVGRPGDVRYTTPLPHTTTPPGNVYIPCLEQLSENSCWFLKFFFFFLNSAKVLIQQ